ncbi:class F sortase [Pseudonocardia sp. P1]|nr:putative secreted protein [Pseudonocardia sp. Ae707_Ps1]
MPGAAAGRARVPMRPARGRRRRSAVRVAGVTTLLGLAMLVADPAGAPEPAASEQVGGPAAPPSAGDRPPAGLLPAGAEPRAESAPVRLRVDRLGLDTGPVPLGLLGDGSLEVPADAGTVGWYTGGPTPGERGPAVLAAHVDWKGLPGAFAELHTLVPGDRIRVDRADGSTVTFAVRHTGQYPKDAFPTGEVYGDLDHAALRLITCGGAFDRSADSYTDNVVVFADLVS